MEHIKLYNGIEMPILGFGVFQIPDANQCEQAVNDALEAGYRLIDTASVYMNEAAVGNAIRKSNIERSKLFITTKLWVQDQGYDQTKQAFKTSLDKLGLDYIDLYLIHWPYGDYYGSWRAMEELYANGKVRAIGVSNFYPGRLSDICLNTKVKPMVNQVEIHPWSQQIDAINNMKELNIQPEAWGPIGGADNVTELLNNKHLLAIATKYGKTAAQVVLRWHIQRGVVAIPKSSRKERIIENINIFDFELNTDEMTIITSIDMKRNCGLNPVSLQAAKILNGVKIHA